MNKIIDKQGGLTFLGFLIVMGVIAAFTLMALRLFPLYNEKFKVLAVMKSVTSQPDAANMSQAEVWKVFYNNADVQGVRMFGQLKTVHDHVKLEKEKGGPPVIHVFFEKRNKLFDDIELVLNFDETMPLSGGAGGGDE
ncbi:MAG: DUF4845 domain-containing protein [Gammaproteobacteria bacterium]